MSDVNDTTMWNIECHLADISKNQPLQRERIAASALAAIITASGKDWMYLDSQGMSNAAITATRYADALIEELNKDIN